MHMYWCSLYAFKCMCIDVYLYVYNSIKWHLNNFGGKEALKDR